MKLVKIHLNITENVVKQNATFFESNYESIFASFNSVIGKLPVMEQN